MEEDLDEEYNEKCRERLVAMYDFDPSTIDWPFQNQKPLGLSVGQAVQVIQDDGGEWVMGHPLDDKANPGFFPRNYMVTVAEYNDMMRNYEEHQAASGLEEDVFRPNTDPKGPPVTRALPVGQMPHISADGRCQDADLRDDTLEEPEIVYPGLKKFPALEAKPPIGTVYELARSKLLREMPTVPEPAEDETGWARDDIEAVRHQLERELAEVERQDGGKSKGGMLSYSRASTPANYAVVRPERDFIRNGTSPYQGSVLSEPMQLADLVRQKIRMSYELPPPYETDLRVRSTTCRLARDIEPVHMKIALSLATSSGGKWTQMFRPGFNDIVNEARKVGCNACLLSRLYQNEEAREIFHKLYALDQKGTFWHDLSRRRTHMFYMRMDYVDVMMCHPDAWGFPDACQLVSANSGEAIDPFHGWYAQDSINADRELEDVEFLYSLRLRLLPEQLFQALSLGKVPEWVAPYLTLCAEAQPELDPRDEEADGGPTPGKAIDADDNMMMEAGLEDSEDLYVRLDELRLAKERTAAPDVLDVEPSSYRLKGLSSMRIFLRSRGNPDNMKQTLISPKMVKDMASQLGIIEEPGRYWYCMFALRWPMSSEWEVLVRNDTRWYLHLPSDRVQLVHPMIKRFREHLDDCKSNEFLWDYRGFNKMKCSECGLPDSVIWCHQCTDNFCAPCYLQMHKSKRGKKHWPMPVPGCRYLTGSEAARLQEFLPLLNAGFSNRRRFLARDNQSDKNGSRNGDTWLYFEADTFHAALKQAPEKHWYLKRLKPPRLAPNVEGYYYNFSTDVIADDASYILTKAAEQKAVSVLQKSMRGALIRRLIKRQTCGAIVIQKTKMMWDVQKTHGNHGKNAGVLKSWFRKHQARENRQNLELRWSKFQAICRGFLARKEYTLMLKNLTKFQAAFRGIRARRLVQRLRSATARSQRALRGLILGRRLATRMHRAAAKIQALFRARADRRARQRCLEAGLRIQCHARGMFGRKRAKLLISSALKLQTAWRRFQGQINVKQLIYRKMMELREERARVLHEKLKNDTAEVIQRNWRKHIAYERYADLRREKEEAYKRTNTMLIAVYSATANLRNFVHPWWRHLPPEIQEVLKSIKVPMQRAIASMPVTGKLANEEVGRRGLRVANASFLEYVQKGKDPDLASHLLLSITRHLLAHVPAEDFAATVRWGCYAVGHEAVHLNKLKGYFPREEVSVAKEIPPHPKDNLATIFQSLNGVRSRSDKLIETPPESLPCLFLQRLPTHQRHVFLTAEVLVTMRQVLDVPSLAADDHLHFQGVDAAAGAQLMEIMSSELDKRLPRDWPKACQTVAALASQAGTLMSELKPAYDKEALKPKTKPKKKGRSKTKPKDPKAITSKAQPEPKSDPKPDPEATQKSDEKSPEVGATDESADADEKEGGVLSHFNRASMMRIMQQIGYFMCGQDDIMEAVLKQNSDDPDMTSTTMSRTTKGTGMKQGQPQPQKSGVRQSRYVAVCDRLFEIAGHAKHDHTNFVLAIVLYHMVFRGLMMRVQYHRAAVALQKRYRYLKTAQTKRNAHAPAITIQRFWRGLSTRLRGMYMDDAAIRIQHTYRAWHTQRQSRRLIKATCMAQRVLKGSIVRKWQIKLQRCARLIQKWVRGMQVRMVFSPKGRELIRKIRQEKGVEIKALEERKMAGEIGHDEFMKGTAAILQEVRLAVAKFRDANIGVRRAESFSIKSTHARRLDKQKKIKLRGTVQIERTSIFEPIALAARRDQEATRTQPVLVVPSRVGQTVRKARKDLERSLGLKTEDPKARDQAAKSHAVANAGRRSARVRRMVKMPKLTVTSKPVDLVDDTGFGMWKKLLLSNKR